MKVAFAVYPCWSAALITYAPATVWLSATTYTVNVPDAVTDTICGTVVIVIVPHVMVIVSDAVKPVPEIVVAMPVFGDSVMVGTVTAPVTVYVAVCVATWLPFWLAVACIVYVPAGCDVPSRLMKLVLYAPAASVFTIVVYALLPFGSVTLTLTRPVAGDPSAVRAPVIVTSAPSA